MYYVERYLNAWMIRKAHEDVFIFGPFNNEGDASFVCEMLNSGKLKYEDGADVGKERIKEPYPIYFYAD